MVSIVNKTKGKLPRLPFKQMKDAVLGKKYNLSLVFVSKKTSQKLNKKHRGKNSPTDILSFSLEKTEGEIVINPDSAKTKAVAPLPTITPTNTVTPTVTPTFTPFPTNPPTNTPTETPTNTPTPPPTPPPTNTPTNTPFPTITPTNTPFPTITPTNTPFPTPPPSGAFMSIFRTTTYGEYIVLPYDFNGTYTGTINWGDGTSTTNSFANSNHSYATPGDYTITITGTINQFSFLLNTHSRQKLINVLQWGPLIISNGGNQFAVCSNLVLSSVTDTLYLVGITNLSNMFTLCNSLTTVNNMNSWSVSTVTNMSGMFLNAASFNQNLNSWNVSNVTNMNDMFYNATSYNQDLSNWCVTNIPFLPNNFYMGNFFWPLPKPVWGTCPP